jgi:hypothetical protein
MGWSIHGFDWPKAEPALGWDSHGLGLTWAGLAWTWSVLVVGWP